MAAMRAPGSKHLIWIWLLIPLAAVAELVFQFTIPRMEPSASEWRKAAAFAKTLKGKDDLIVAAPRFETQALLYLKGAVSDRDFGRFDISLYKNIIALSINGAKAPETAGLRLLKERSFGRITVHKFLNPKPARQRYDFISALHQARFLGRGAKQPLFLVDSRFIQRLAIELKPQMRATSVTFDNVPLDGDIYGYAFIAITDFRSEVYDRDGPLLFEVFVDSRKVGTRQVHKGDAMTPFRFKTGKKGTGTVRFEVRALKPFSHYGFGFTADIRG